MLHNSWIRVRRLSRLGRRWQPQLCHLHCRAPVLSQRNSRSWVDWNVVSQGYSVPDVRAIDLTSLILSKSRWHAFVRMPPTIAPAQWPTQLICSPGHLLLTPHNPPLTPRSRFVLSSPVGMDIVLVGLLRQKRAVRAAAGRKWQSPTTHPSATAPTTQPSSTTTPTTPTM
jgi:hypothetical protein